VDLSSYLAGPLIGEILADWGADVVKVEPPDGDPFRVFPISVLVASQHKRSVALDIGAPGGADVLLRLLRGADLFVENMRPGRMERAGLTPERVLAGNPGLVRCSVSAYGHAGEYADAPGFDPVFQALTTNWPRPSRRRSPTGRRATRPGRSPPVGSRRFPSPWATSTSRPRTWWPTASPTWCRTRATAVSTSPAATGPGLRDLGARRRPATGAHGARRP
jgi:hypothetical protein